PEQGPHEAPLAGGHAEQRPPAGRGRQAVEDRLDLVGGGVARGEVACAGERRGGRVALGPGPGMEVALALAGRATDLERGTQLIAHRAAVALVAVRVRSQAV